MSLVLTRLDCGNANFAVIPLYLLKRLKSVMNSAARLVFSSSRYYHNTPFLRQLRSLKARERMISSSLSLSTRVNMEQHCRTLPTNLDSQQTSRLDVVCVPPLHRH